jgi:hypothetical protein
MDKEQQKRKLLKLAKEAFERACTLSESQRIEVYLLDGKAEMSDILRDDESLVYGDNRILCYQIYGHDYLEGEIKTWIDLGRIIVQPTDDMPMPEPTEIETAIRELAAEIAKTRGVASEQISSNEIFANLPVDLLEQIENSIIEYWWQGELEENGKTLATEQIEAALKTI